MTTWPTTKGMSAVIDSDAIRQYLTDELPVQWGARVDQRMKDLNLRNVQVAVRAGTTAQTISKVRKGELCPRDYLRVSISAALSTTPAELFPLPSTADLITRTSRKRKKTVAA